MKKIYSILVFLSILVSSHGTIAMNNFWGRYHNNPLLKGLMAGQLARINFSQNEIPIIERPVNETPLRVALGEVLFDPTHSQDFSELKNSDGYVLKYQIACLLLKDIITGKITPEDIPHTWDKLKKLFVCALPRTSEVLSRSPVDLLKNKLIHYKVCAEEFGDNENLHLSIRRALLNVFLERIEPSLFNLNFTKEELLQVPFVIGLGGGLMNEIPEELKIYSRPGKFYSETHREIRNGLVSAITGCVGSKMVDIIHNFFIHTYPDRGWFADCDSFMAELRYFDVFMSRWCYCFSSEVLLLWLYDHSEIFALPIQEDELSSTIHIKKSIRNSLGIWIGFELGQMGLKWLLNLAIEPEYKM